MNSFDKHGFNEDDFGAKGNVVQAFDAFPKSKPEFITRTEGGGKWTVVVFVVSFFLLWSETARWWRGSEEHTFAVEKGVSHQMQINLDAVVKMQCDDLHINVQDSSGDRILAGQTLNHDPTVWQQWADAKGVHKLNHDSNGRIDTGAGWLNAEATEEGFGEEHVHDIVALGKKRAKWARTPRLRGTADSCRIYGSLDLNKVQGDFHITARGHGYLEMSGEHLDHSQFNFSHIVSELSFGSFYPSLINPLDQTVNLASDNFHRFQYYLSVVPTVYTVGRSTIMTNQYAVTEQSKAISAHTGIPGIFVKYDIEPILLHVRESRDTFIVFLLKLINVVSGVLVAGHWGFTFFEWANEVRGKKSRSHTGSEGMLGAKGAYMA